MQKPEKFEQETPQQEEKRLANAAIDKLRADLVTPARRLPTDGQANGDLENATHNQYSAPAVWVREIHEQNKHGRIGEADLNRLHMSKGAEVLGIDKYNQVIAAQKNSDGSLTVEHFSFWQRNGLQETGHTYKNAAAGIEAIASDLNNAPREERLRDKSSTEELSETEKALAQIYKVKLHGDK